MNKSLRQWTVGRRQSFANRSGLRLIAHSRPEADAFASWLGSLGQLRSPAALDRAILDSVHQNFHRGPRAQPVLVLSVTLCCVVFGAVVKFHPGETATSATLARSAESEKPQLYGPSPSEPARITTKNLDLQSPAILQAAINKPLFTAVSPLATATYRPKARPALASHGLVIASRQQARPVMEVMPAIRLASVALPRAATPIVDSQPLAVGTGSEALPTSTERDAIRPSVQIVNALSWSSPVTTQIKLHERVNGMVSPTGLFASLPPARDSGRRPIYKRAWFVGMLGVAATGIAAGVTAAVVSAQQQQQPGLASQPIRISLGPT